MSFKRQHMNLGGKCKEDKREIGGFILPFSQGNIRAYSVSEWKITWWREKSYTGGMTVQFWLGPFTCVIYC